MAQYVTVTEEAWGNGRRADASSQPDLNIQGEVLVFQHTTRNNSHYRLWEEPFVTFLGANIRDDASEWTSANARDAGVEEQPFYTRFIQGHETGSPH